MARDVDQREDAWAAPGAALAFVGLAGIGNGRLDDGYEPVRRPHRSQTARPDNGWEALSELDTTGERCSRGDPAWADLLLWFDS